MASDAATFAVDRVLRDGGSIHIRAIAADDKARLNDHFARLSARSVYFRFFRVKKRLTDDELRLFTELDFERQVGLVATLRSEHDERIIGVGRYAEIPAPAGQARRAEVAFAVADDHQRRGIGAVLLEHLAEIARRHGIEEFEADVLGENNGMLSVFLRSGFRVTRALEQGVFHLSFPTEATAESIAVQERRERAAAAASMRSVLAPRAVAIVGASERAGSLGGALLDRLRAGGFRGPVYPVHRTAASIAGLPAFARVSDIGAPVDLALVAVPADALPDVVTDCAAAGVRAVVVASGGFAETGPAGREAQRRLAALVRASGMRLVGPNSMGVLNSDPEVSLDATAAAGAVPPGGVGLLAQSGAVSLALLERCARLGIGLSSFVSVGNKADVSGNDLLAYWNEDPRTTAVLLYLESFGNPRRFAQLAPEVARQKPIVAVAASRGALRGAASGGRDIVVDALFEQAGVIRTDSLEELFEVAALVARQPIPAGPRVAAVSNAAGLAAFFGSTALAGGLSLPALTAETREILTQALPPAVTLANPLDLLAPARPADYTAALTALGAQADVDAVVAIFVSPRPSDAETYAAAIAAGAAAVPAHKPVVAVFLCGGSVPLALHAGGRGRLPVYEFPESAARALAATARYAAWRWRPRGDALALSGAAEEAVRAVVDRVRATGAEPVTLTPADLAAILQAVGIRQAMSEQVRLEDAADAGERLGYPLVVKAARPPHAGGHKTPRPMRLGLRTAADVATAIAELHAEQPDLATVILQREVEPVLEARVGVCVDPTFGPLVTCGLGGAIGVLAHDVAHRLPPVSDIDAETMLGSLRLAPLLDGYYGSAPADRTALLDLIRRVSALVAVIPEIVSLELDPIALFTPGGGAVVLNARLTLG